MHEISQWLDFYDDAIFALLPWEIANKNDHMATFVAIQGEANPPSYKV